MHPTRADWFTNFGLILILLMGSCFEYALTRPHSDRLLDGGKPYMPGPPFQARFGGGGLGQMKKKRPFVVAPIILGDVDDTEDEQQDLILPAQALLSLLANNPGLGQKTAQPATSPTVMMVPQFIPTACNQQIQPASTMPGSPRSGFPEAVNPLTGSPRSGFPQQMVTGPVIQHTTPSPADDLNNLINQMQEQQKKRLQELEQEHQLEKLRLMTEASDQVMTQALEQAKRNQQLLQQLAQTPEVVPMMPEQTFPSLTPNQRSGFPTGLTPQQQQPLTPITMTPTSPADLMSQLFGQPTSIPATTNINNLVQNDNPLAALLGPLQTTQTTTKKSKKNKKLNQNQLMKKISSLFDDSAYGLEDGYYPNYNYY